VKTNPVKKALQQGKPQVGTWLSLGSVVAARFLARTGLPWLTVDMEHTHTDIQTATYMFAAIADAGCVPLARIPTGKHEYIKMVLDSGAMGIVAPMVMDADEARSIVAATKYPPRGNRSVGGGMHAINFGATSEEYYRRADDEILVILQTEHIDAVNIADEIYSVPGIDAIFVGPNDLSYSMRSADGSFPDKATFETTLTRIREAAQRNRVPCGLHVFSPADALRRAREGWQFIAVNSELKMMLEGAADLTKQVSGEPHPEGLAKYR
jgi:4-hydroxy-2-oxoheptanedioate aldolase